MFVIVSGPPASGKSTVTHALAPKLGLPVIAKDVIKQALMDALGLPDSVEESHRLGQAAVHAMLAVAATNPGAVLDSVWMPYTIPLISELDGPIVEVHCRVSRATAEARYLDRAPHRHPGHLSDQRPADELWSTQLVDPLGVGSIVEVDTERPLDPDRLAARVRAGLRPTVGNAGTEDSSGSR